MIQLRSFFVLCLAYIVISWQWNGLVLEGVLYIGRFDVRWLLLLGISVSVG